MFATKSLSVASNVTSEFVRPRLHFVPLKLADATLATEAIEFVADIGYLLDPWQEFQTEQSLLVDLESDDLTWLCLEYGFLAPRQNGKGGVYTARTITDLFYLPCYDHYGRRKPRLVVYTAHQFKTSSEAFERAKDVIEGSDTLRKMMKKDRTGGIRNSAIEKGFDLANGNRMRYLARSTGGSGRGWTIDSLFTDESQEMPQTAWDALKYTQRALVNPQRLLTGTVPVPENNSEVWTAARDRGRGLRSQTAGWSEYSPDPDDPETVADMTKPAKYGHEVDPELKYALATNPAFGIRITPRQLIGDADGNAESYKREVVDWWPNDSGESQVLANWKNLHDPASVAVDPVVLALEVSDDLQWASIIATGHRVQDSLVHVELVDYRQGLEWVPDALLALRMRWRPQVVLLDIGGPAGVLKADLEAAGVVHRPLTVRELGQSCLLFHDQVVNGRLRWLNHPALNRAIRAAKWRGIGQAGLKAWDRLVDVDVSPLLSGSMAVWGLLTGAEAEIDVLKQKQVSNRMYGFNR